MWEPWIGHWFPGITPDHMSTLALHQYIAMHDFVKASRHDG